MLMGSLAGNVALYQRATRPLYAESDQPLIDRTLAMAAVTERTSPENLRAQTFPISMSLGGGRTCIEIRDLGGHGSHGACYDRAGRLIEQIDSVSDF